MLSLARTSYAPAGAERRFGVHRLVNPRLCAVGYILPPLRGSDAALLAAERDAELSFATYAGTRNQAFASANVFTGHCPLPTAHCPLRLPQLVRPGGQLDD